MENKVSEKAEAIQVVLDNSRGNENSTNAYDIFIACIPALIAMATSVIVVILTQMWGKRNEVRLKFYGRRLDALEKINESSSRFFDSMSEMYHKKKRGKECIEHVHHHFVELSNAISSAGIYLTKDERALIEDCQLRVAMLQYTNWKRKIPKEDYEAMLVIKCFLDDTLREIALDKQPRWMKRGHYRRKLRNSRKNSAS